jgi:hypothetical protein
MEAIHLILFSQKSNKLPNYWIMLSPVSIYFQYLYLYFIQYLYFQYSQYLYYKS